MGKKKEPQPSTSKGFYAKNPPKEETDTSDTPQSTDEEDIKKKPVTPKTVKRPLNDLGKLKLWKKQRGWTEKEFKKAHKSLNQFQREYKAIKKTWEKGTKQRLKETQNARQRHMDLVNSLPTREVKSSEEESDNLLKEDELMEKVQEPESGKPSISREPASSQRKKNPYELERVKLWKEERGWTDEEFKKAHESLKTFFNERTVIDNRWRNVCITPEDKKNRLEETKAARQRFNDFINTLPTKDSSDEETSDNLQKKDDNKLMKNPHYKNEIDEPRNAEEPGSSKTRTKRKRYSDLQRLKDMKDQEGWSDQVFKEAKDALHACSNKQQKISKQWRNRCITREDKEQRLKQSNDARNEYKDFLQTLCTQSNESSETVDLENPDNWELKVSAELSAKAGRKKLSEKNQLKKMKAEREWTDEEFDRANQSRNEYCNMRATINDKWRDIPMTKENELQKQNEKEIAKAKHIAVLDSLPKNERDLTEEDVKRIKRNNQMHEAKRKREENLTDEQKKQLQQIHYRCNKETDKLNKKWGFKPKPMTEIDQKQYDIEYLEIKDRKRRELDELLNITEDSKTPKRRFLDLKRNVKDMSPETGEREMEKYALEKKMERIAKRFQGFQKMSAEEKLNYIEKRIDDSRKQYQQIKLKFNVLTPLEQKQVTDSFIQRIQKWTVCKRNIRLLEQTKDKQKHNEEKRIADRHFLGETRIQPITQPMRERIEQTTKPGSTSSAWRSERRGCVTGTKVGRIVRNKTADLEKLANSMMYVGEGPVYSQAMFLGRYLERTAVQSFMRRMEKQDYEYPIGFMKHPQLNFIGSTPDAMIGNDTIVEVKFSMTPISEKKDYLKKAQPGEKTGSFLDDQTRPSPYTLNQNHPYYFQVITQMICTQAKKGYFVAYHDADPDPDKWEYFVQEISQEDAERCWFEIEPKLIDFYRKYFLEKSKHDLIKPSSVYDRVKAQKETKTQAQPVKLVVRKTSARKVNREDEELEDDVLDFYSSDEDEEVECLCDDTEDDTSDEDSNDDENSYDDEYSNDDEDSNGDGEEKDTEKPERAKDDEDNQHQDDKSKQEERKPHRYPTRSRKSSGQKEAELCMEFENMSVEDDPSAERPEEQVDLACNIQQDEELYEADLDFSDEDLWIEWVYNDMILDEETKIRDEDKVIPCHDKNEDIERSSGAEELADGASEQGQQASCMVVEKKGITQNAIDVTVPENVQPKPSVSRPEKQFSQTSSISADGKFVREPSMKNPVLGFFTDIKSSWKTYVDNKKELKRKKKQEKRERRRKEWDDVLNATKERLQKYHGTSQINTEAIYAQLHAKEKQRKHEDHVKEEIFKATFQKNTSTQGSFSRSLNKHDDELEDEYEPSTSHSQKHFLVNQLAGTLANVHLKERNVTSARSCISSQSNCDNPESSKEVIEM